MPSDYKHWKTSSLRIALAQAKRNQQEVGPDFAHNYDAQIERLTKELEARGEKI